MCTDNGNNSLVSISSGDLEKSIETLAQPLAMYIRDLGLPTDNILSSLEERGIVIRGIKDVINQLPINEKERATYLTKFIVAVSIGLFDGALNYLWNQTIDALRRLAERFDLAYFFSVLEAKGMRYKEFSTFEDLEKVDDHDLLDTSRRIGLLTDINYRRLENINYLRNHASAAHPNENEIDGQELLVSLLHCIKYAITATPKNSLLTVRALLANIRTVEIPKDDYPYIGNQLVRLPQERIDGLLSTVFGMFVDPKQNVTARANVQNIALYIWNASTENRRYEIGLKFGLYRTNADVARKEASQEFLRIVDGENYKDEDSLTAELWEKREILQTVHFGTNNFYNEEPHAKSLGLSLPRNGKVPRSVRALWVKVICLCYIGNGYGHRNGVCEGAIPYYKKHIILFTEIEIIEFLHLMGKGDVEFTEAFGRVTAARRVKNLVEIFRSKTDNIHALRALSIITETPETKLESLPSVYHENLKHLPK